MARVGQRLDARAPALDEGSGVLDVLGNHRVRRGAGRPWPRKGAGGVAAKIADGRLELSKSSLETTMVDLEKIAGIGPWTAHYVAMRGLGWPDAFPASDLGILKALKLKNARIAEERARAWMPWRSYAVMHLWNSLSAGGAND